MRSDDDDDDDDKPPSVADAYMYSVAKNTTMTRDVIKSAKTRSYTFILVKH